MTQKTQLLGLSVLLLLLLATRIIPGLNNESLWGDEGWSIRFTDGDGLRDVSAALAEDRHPPLYFWMLYGWRHLTGDDEIPLRFLAALGELLAAAVLFRLGRALFDAPAGLAALLIFVLLDKQIVFSREVRHYTWLMLWTAASTWALWAMLRRDRPRWRWLYLLTVIAGLYTHTFMLIVLLVHGIYTFPPRRTLIYLWLCAGIAFAPWSLIFYNQFSEQGGLRHDFPLTWDTAELLTREFLGVPVALFAGLLLIGVFSPFLHVYAKSRPRFHSVLLPVLGAALPVIVVVGLPQINDSWRLLTDRNLAIMLPFLALLGGLGLTAFKGFPRTALIAFLLVNGLLTSDVDPNHPPMRPIARYVAAHQVDDQPVIFETGGADPSLEYHLKQEGLAEVPLLSILNVRKRMEQDPAFEPFAYLRFEVLNNVDGFWYIYWNNDPQFLNALEGWGYIRTATAFDTHLGAPIYMYRYDAPSLLEEENTAWQGGIQLHRVATEIQEDVLAVSLWWSSETPLSADYTVSVFLLNDAGTLVEQHDGYPGEGRAPTSSWAPNTLIYDAHRIPFEPGQYELCIKVYNGADGSILLTKQDTDYACVGNPER
jgi:mannosyltransferase